METTAPPKQTDTKGTTAKQSTVSLADAVSPLVISIVFFAVSVVIMSVSDLAAYERRVRDPTPLSDIFHDIVPPYTKNSLPPQIILGAYLLAGFVIVMMNDTAPHLLKRFFFQTGVVLLIRSTLVPLTSLPDPSPGCTGDDPLGSNPYLSIWMFKSCGDLVFSGHVTFMVSMALVLFEAYPVRRVWHAFLHTASLVIIAVEIYFIFATRMHYSIDVAVAVLINLLIWGVGKAMSARFAVMTNPPMLVAWFASDVELPCAPCQRYGMVIKNSCPCPTGNCCAGAGCTDHCCEGCEGCDCCCVKVELAQQHH